MKHREPGRAQQRADTQWREFQRRANARAAAWAAGEGGGGVAKYRRERREARRTTMTAAEKRADSLSSYEFALWQKRNSA